MAIFTGTSGDDVVFVGPGVADTFVNAAPQDTTFIGWFGSGWTIGSSQGTDSLTSIETLQLQDATFTLGVGGAYAIGTVGLTVSTGLTPPANTHSVLRLGDGSYISVLSTVSGFVFQKITAAGELSAPISALSTNSVQPSELVTASLGTAGFVVAWREDSPSGADIYYRRYDLAGNPIGDRQLAHVVTGFQQTKPSIVTLNNGNFVIGWQDSGNDGSSNGVYGRVFNSTGTALGSEFRINALADNSQNDVSLAALSGGGFVAVYTDQTNGATRYQRYDASGNTVGLDNPAGNFSGTRPGVLALSADRILIAGWQSPGSGNALRYQILDSNGFSIGDTVTVVPSGRNGAHAPELLRLSDGGFVIAWSDLLTGLSTQRYDSAGNAIGGVVSLEGGADTTDIHMAADAAGGYTVEYVRADFKGVYTLRFDADNLPVLPTVTGDSAANVIQAGSTTVSGLRLIGGAGNDTLIGTMFGDILDGVDGADRLQGGLGDDTYIVNGDERILEGVNRGIDTVVVRDSYSLTANNVENMRLLGTAAANLSGNSMDNLIYGNRADNVINGRGGNDKMYGGNGNDTYYLDSTQDRVIERANEGIDTIVANFAIALPVNVENFRGLGSSGVQAFGNALDNYLIGTTGDDNLFGGGGNDTLQGGKGNDAYDYDGGDQIIEELDGGIDSVNVKASYVLDENVENAAISVSGNLNLTGNGLANTLYGYDDNNVIDGGAGADTMIGLEGADVYIVDNIGDVVIESGTGLDEVRASVTYSLVDTNAENLTLTGRNAINGTGSTADNVIRGNAAANVLSDGDGGSDRLFGYGGNDTLIADGTQDTLVGGSGNDTYVVDTTDAVLVELAGQGTDSVFAKLESGMFVLAENIENLTLTGTSGSTASGQGNSLANVIAGNDGANLLDGGGGADTLIGGLGDDIYVVDNSADVITEAANGGEDSIESSLSRALGANVENLRLTGSANINGTGNSAANAISGNSGANVLVGLAGNDTLVGGGGADTLQGGDDNDRLTGGAGNDVLDGGNGNDTAIYRSIAAGVTVDLSITAVAQNTGLLSGSDRLIGIENVIGSDTGSDTLWGDSAGNRLVGGGSGDTLDGRGGNDVLRGGEGNDTLVGGAGDDIIDGGNDMDAVSYLDAVTGVTVDLGNSDPQATGDGTDTLIGIENLLGSATGGDTLTGDYQANFIDGDGGNDVIAGDDGADVLTGGVGNDTVSYAGAIGDVVVNLTLGTASNDGFGNRDTLSGFENIIGSQFDDSLRGDSAANVIEGGGGRDVMRGLAGADTFVLRNLSDTTTSSTTRDVIADFTTGSDRIDLSAIDANTTVAADQAFTFIGSAAFSSVAGQLRFSGTLLEGDVNGDGVADLTITVAGSATLAAADFVL